jgi:excisionase family DNA binding protein
MHLRQVGTYDVTPDKKVLVTVEEAAAMLSLGRTLAWALVRKNELRSIKVGNTRRVVVSSLHEYVGRQLEQAN